MSEATFYTKKSKIKDLSPTVWQYLKRLVRSIQGVSVISKEDYTEGVEIIDTIIECVSKMSFIVKLLLYRTVLWVTNLHVTEVSLTTLIKQIKKNNPTSYLIWKIQEDLPFVRRDERQQQRQQLLTIIMDNAVKFSTAAKQPIIKTFRLIGRLVLQKTFVRQGVALALIEKNCGTTSRKNSHRKYDK